MKWIILSLLIFAGCRSDRIPAESRENIISLSPHITEILYAIGAQDQVLAVTDFCTYPPETAQKQRIGGLLNPNFERIIALRPAMLIGVPAHQDFGPKLAPYGISLILLPNETVADILRSIDTLGVITGKAVEAEKLKAMLQDSLASFPGVHKTRRAMIVIGRDEGAPKNITVAGPGSFISEIWSGMGGANIFEDLGSRYATVSREAILTRNPELIIEFRHADQEDDATVVRVREEWKSFSKLRAVREEKIFILTGAYGMIPGPRLYLLARDFRRIMETASGGRKNEPEKNVNKM